MGHLSSIFSDDEIPRDDCFLALDIGTGSVKAAIFNIVFDKEKRSAKAVITGAGKSFFGGSETGSDFTRILKACEEAKEVAEEMAGTQAEKTFISMAGSLVRGYADVLKHEREEPGKLIDLSEMKSVIQKLQWKIFETIKKGERAARGLPEAEIKLVAGTIIGMEIDGVKVFDPIGFEGREMSFVILNVFSTRRDLKFFSRLEKELEIEIIFLASQPCSVLAGVSEKVFKAGSLADISCVLIDCGARKTDVSLAASGFICGPETISVGGEAFTRRLSAGFDMSAREAEDLKLKYSRGEVSSRIKRKITGLAGPGIKFWLVGVEAVLRDFLFSSQKSFTKILLCGGANALPGIKKILEDDDWRANMGFASPVKADFISADDFAGVSDETDSLECPQDVALLALVKAGLDLIRKESAVDLILSRVIRLMQT